MISSPEPRFSFSPPMRLRRNDCWRKPIELAGLHVAGLFLARFQPQHPQDALGHIVRGLGCFDDIEPDDQLPVSRQTIVDYCTRRHPSVIAALGRMPP